jgi:hypothetical protein
MTGMHEVPYSDVSFREFLPDINEGLENETKRFIELLTHAPYHLVASGPVNGVICDVLTIPALLARLEELIGGTLVQHPDISSSSIMQGYRQTLMFYRAAYGKPREDVWADPRNLAFVDSCAPAAFSISHPFNGW